MNFKQFFKEDTNETRKISVFDFDGTLICLKDRYYDIFYGYTEPTADEERVLLKHFPELAERGMESYYVSPKSVLPEFWHLLHDIGPVTHIAAERAADPQNNIVYILTARDRDPEFRSAIREYAASQGIEVPDFRIMQVGHQGAAAKKAQVLGWISDAYPNSEIDFFDDRQDYIDAANRIDRVNAIKV